MNRNVTPAHRPEKRKTGWHVGFVAAFLLLLWIFKFQLALAISTHTTLGPIVGPEYLSRIGTKIWGLGMVYLLATVAIGAAGTAVDASKAGAWADRGFSAAWIPATSFVLMTIILVVFNLHVQLASLVGTLVGLALCVLINPYSTGKAAPQQQE